MFLRNAWSDSLKCIAHTGLWCLLFAAGLRNVNADELSERRSTSPSAKLSEQVVNLLRSKCVNCHGAETAEGNLRLDSRELMLQGGDRGSAIVLGKPEESLLYKSVAYLSEDLEMPPKNPLTPTEISEIKNWLQAGANWPETKSTQSPVMQAETQPIGDAWTDPRNPIVRIFGGQRLDLWSLQRVRTPPVPETSNTDWGRGELDRFVLVKYESKGLQPPARADSRTLVRRLHFDLTGLPPSLETMAKFETDNVEQLVDQLLDSEQFGQHWARMWLDVARYSDSNGYDWDEFRTQAWRYRDYVIRSFNADKPYHLFVLEQLAGDELFSGQPQVQSQQESLIATGFLRLGPHDNAAKLFNEQDRSRDELLTDLVETTGSALLGITLSCCRCHDHKYDPISQADHFRLRACFAGVAFADELSIDLADEQEQIQLHNARIDDEIASLQAEKQSLLDSIAKRLDDEATSQQENEPSYAIAAEKKENDEAQLLKFATESELPLLDKTNKSIEEAKRLKKSLTHAMLMVESTEAMPETYLLFQGDYKSPRERVEPGILSVLDPNSLPPAQSLRDGSSGRRLALAQWIISPENPLTSRVFVNRVWQNLMGRGLVETPGDFGLAGATPSEPELLDWLASRFVQEGWSIKTLVRSIVLSATYQQAATYGEPNSEVAHLTRLPRRLTAEQLRDSMLMVSGLLTMKSSGPPVWPELPKDVLEANPAFLDDNETKTKGWYPSPAEQQHCRSIFLVQKRNTRVPFLETFDQPENSVPCARRLSSVVAPQALSLLNGPEAVAAARRFAERVAAAHKKEVDRIHHAFRLSVQRDPIGIETQACQEFLEHASWTELCRVLLNINEFAYCD